MGSVVKETKTFDVNKSIQRLALNKKQSKVWNISTDGKNYAWANGLERIEIIRRGLPYGVIESVSTKISRPVKYVLSIIGMPQTTYNKKKNEHSLLNRSNTELVIAISELCDYGLDVFNQEEDKFHRWLKKPNMSLGDNTPESLFDTLGGINEVRYCLNRLEFGNLA